MERYNYWTAGYSLVRALFLFIFWITILGDLGFFLGIVGRILIFLLVIGLNQGLDCDFLGGKFVFLISFGIWLN